MAQYCRYCTELVVGDVAWCGEKKKVIPERLAKTTNYCPYYDLNRIDAFGENERGYRPRNKRSESSQCEGQLSLDDLAEIGNLEKCRNGL